MPSFLIYSSVEMLPRFLWKQDFDVSQRKRARLLHEDAGHTLLEQSTVGRPDPSATGVSPPEIQPLPLVNEDNQDEQSHGHNEMLQSKRGQSDVLDVEGHPSLLDSSHAMRDNLSRPASASASASSHINAAMPSNSVDVAAVLASAAAVTAREAHQGDPVTVLLAASFGQPSTPFHNSLEHTHSHLHSQLQSHGEIQHQNDAQLHGSHHVNERVADHLGEGPDTAINGSTIGGISSGIVLSSVMAEAAEHGDFLLPALHQFIGNDPDTLQRVRHPSFQAGLTLMLQGSKHQPDCPAAGAGTYNHTRDCTCVRRSPRPGVHQFKS